MSAPKSRWQEFDGQERAYYGGAAGRIIKNQYLALLDALGTKPAADRLAREMIIAPPNAPWPNPENFMAWAHHWQLGVLEADPKLVRLMKQRLMAHEEWENRRFIHKLREAGNTVADKAKDGTLASEKQVQLKYIADGVAMVTRDTAAAYGTPKPTPTQIQQLNIVNNAPPRRLRAPKKEQTIDTTAIDVTVRELTSGTSSDRA